MVATPFHGSSGSSLGLDTSAPSISGGEERAEQRGHRTTVLDLVALHGRTHRVLLEDRSEALAGGAPAIFQ